VIKKFLQKLFKLISYGIYFKIYGRIKNHIGCEGNSNIDVKNLDLGDNLKYKVYKVNNGRLYTDRIHDTAVILDNSIIEGPSFQLRYTHDLKMYNSKIKDNVVFTKGTPRKLKNINNSVLSLLTGGGGNTNYWHWLFDVLPRLNLCNKYKNLSEIDFFLLPSLLKKFQNETLDYLKIPEHKRLSSEKFRHIKAKQLILTDHPVVVTGDATSDIQNIPKWILDWLKNTFVKENLEAKNKKKIYIDRSEAKYNAPQRLISNENEIKEYLLNKDFVPIKLGDTKFDEQVEIFNKADCIVGLHGAGFANLAFCKPETRIVEFRSFEAGPVIENLAKKNNLNYCSIITDAKHTNKHDFPNQQGSIEVPISNLEKVLES
tara:strand:- start:2641 stop:3759 length:1119 start_codon:yes stop_codon:yes gene_type:complete